VSAGGISGIIGRLREHESVEGRGERRILLLLKPTVGGGGGKTDKTGEGALRAAKGRPAGCGVHARYTRAPNIPGARPSNSYIERANTY